MQSGFKFWTISSSEWTWHYYLDLIQLYTVNNAGLEIQKKMSRRKFVTSYENLVANLKSSVVKLIEAI